MSKKIKQIAVYDKDNGTWDSYQIQGNSSSASSINATNVVLSSSILGSTNINDVLSTAFDSASTGLITGTTDRIVYVNGATKKLTSFGLTPNNIQTTIQKVGSSSVPNWGGPTNIMNLLGSTNISSSCIGFGDGTITGTIKDLVDNTKNFFELSLLLSSRKTINGITVTLPASNIDSNVLSSTFAPKKPGLYLISAQCQHSSGASNTMRESGLALYYNYANRDSYEKTNLGCQRIVKTNNTALHTITGFYNITRQHINNNNFFGVYGSNLGNSSSNFQGSLSYMYFYTPINLRNTAWVLKDNIDLSSTFDYSITFNHTNPNGPLVTRIIANNGVLSYVTSNSTVLVYNNGWVNNGYKVMNIRGGDDVINQSLADWLESNHV